MAIRTYICDHCDGEFETTDELDEAALAEAEAMFGVKDADKDEEMAHVCHDCFKELIAVVNRKVN